METGVRVGSLDERQRRRVRRRYMGFIFQRVARGEDRYSIPADELTTSLDRKNGDQVVGLLRDAARTANRTVVIVTRDLRVDRSVLLSDGELAA